MNVPPPLASSSVPPASAWVGYACLAPLGVGLAAIALGGDSPLRELAQRGTLAWGAALLAFTGAVHAGLMFAGRLSATPAHVTGTLLPAVAAAVAVLLNGQRGLALLAVGFGVFWLYEHRVLGSELSEGYLTLRRHLSIVACGVLALAMLASDAAGLA